MAKIIKQPEQNIVLLLTDPHLLIWKEVQDAFVM